MKNELSMSVVEKGVAYTLHGDYYFPEITVPEEEHASLGKYGLMRMEYLKEHRPVLFNQLLLTGRLYTHLAELDAQSHRRLERIIRQMADIEGVTEKLKAADCFEWVRQMNSIRNRAEEIVLKEIVFA